MKYDINFLEYPDWIVNTKKVILTWHVHKEYGRYEMRSTLGLPRHFDKLVFYFLLYKLHEVSFVTSVLKTSRYEIAKNVFPYEKDFGKNRYSRIMQSLKKWQDLSIEFEGLFFEHDEYTQRYFSLIDEVILKKKSGELSIRFNDSYIAQIKKTDFYLFIDFEQYKRLKKASSARLYEILCKNFKERKEWAIQIQLLAEKLTFEKRKGATNYYPSDVLCYLRPAVQEINEKTNLHIKLVYKEDTHVCVFKNLPKQRKYVPAVVDKKELKKREAMATKQKARCLEKFKTLSGDEQQRILDDIARQPFLAYLPERNDRIYAYMHNKRGLYD